MSFGVVRIELDGMPVRGNGFRAPALLLKHRPEIVVAHGVIRPQLDFPAHQPFGACEIALLGRDDGKIAAGCGVATDQYSAAGRRDALRLR